MFNTRFNSSTGGLGPEASWFSSISARCFNSSTGGLGQSGRGGASGRESVSIPLRVD